MVVVLLVVGFVALAIVSGDGDDGDETQDASANLAALDELLGEMKAESADYPSRLLILGNANCDDVLDEYDVSYVEGLIANGYVYTEEYMADANYDGVIDQEDYDIVKALVEGEQDLVYYINVDYEVASYNTSYPLNTANTLTQTLEMLCILCPETIVATDERCSYDSSSGTFYTEFEYLLDYSSLYCIGSHSSPDADTFIEVAEACGGYLTVWMNSADEYGTDYIEDDLADYPGIQILRLPSWENGATTSGLLTAGYLFDAATGTTFDYATEVVEWIDEAMEEVEDRVASVDEDDRKKVVVTWINSWSGSDDTEFSLLYKGSGEYNNLLRLGVVDVTDEYMTDNGLTDYYATVTAEDMEGIYEDYGIDVVVGTIAAPYSATADDMAEAYESRSEQLSALEGTELMVTGWIYASGPAEIVFCYLLGYYLYPDQFSYSDVVDIVNSYLTFFGTFGFEYEGQWTFSSLNLMYCGEDSAYNLMA